MKQPGTYEICFNAHYAGLQGANGPLEAIAEFRTANLGELDRLREGALWGFGSGPDEWSARLENPFIWLCVRDDYFDPLKEFCK